MRKKTTILLLISTFCISVVAANAQEKVQVQLTDFVGNWKVDKEKTYSKSERKDVESYTVKVSLNDKTLTVYWDYTIMSKGKPAHSYYHQDFVIDGKEKDFRKKRTNLDHDAWAQTASFNGKEIKCQNNYRTDLQTVGSYLDYQTLSFSNDNKYLIIESVNRSADRFAQNETQTQKLYLVKEN